ncbi:MAG: hypothetical protein ACRER5_03055 [Pseudomonas sp.]
MTGPNNNDRDHSTSAMIPGLSGNDLAEAMPDTFIEAISEEEDDEIGEVYCYKYAGTTPTFKIEGFGEVSVEAVFAEQRDEALPPDTLDPCQLWFRLGGEIIAEVEMMVLDLRAEPLLDNALATPWLKDRVSAFLHINGTPRESVASQWPAPPALKDPSTQICFVERLWLAPAFESTDLLRFIMSTMQWAAQAVLELKKPQLFVQVEEPYSRLFKDGGAPLERTPGSWMLVIDVPTAEQVERLGLVNWDSHPAQSSTWLHQSLVDLGGITLDPIDHGWGEGLARVCKDHPTALMFPRLEPDAPVPAIDGDWLHVD